LKGIKDNLDTILANISREMCSVRKEVMLIVCVI
jgi:hypothetical protein